MEASVREDFAGFSKSDWRWAQAAESFERTSTMGVYEWMDIREREKKAGHYDADYWDTDALKDIVEEYGVDVKMEPRKHGHAMSEEQWKASDFYREGIQYRPDMTPERAQAYSEWYDKRKFRQDLIGRGDEIHTGFWNKAQGFGMSMLGGLPDPVNLVSFTGGAFAALKGATLGTKILRGMVTGAAEGALGSIAVDAVRIPQLQLQGEELTWKDYALDAGIGMALGAFLGGAGGALGHWWGGKFRPKSPTERIMENAPKKGVNPELDVRMASDDYVAARDEKLAPLRDSWKRQDNSAFLSDEGYGNIVDLLDAHVRTVAHRSGKDPIVVLDEVLGGGVHVTTPEEVHGLLDRIATEEAETHHSFMGEKGAAELDRRDGGTRMAGMKAAEQMETEGRDALAIKVATGWERGADGKWRYEVPTGNFKDKVSLMGVARLKEIREELDSGRKDAAWAKDMYSVVRRWRQWQILDDDMKTVRYTIPDRKDGTIRLMDIWEDPDLYAAYPELANYKVIFESSQDTRGYFDLNNQTIMIENSALYDLVSNREVFAHEIQHFIQAKEGFVRGSSPEAWERQINTYARDEARTEIMKAESDFRHTIAGIITSNMEWYLTRYFEFKTNEKGDILPLFGGTKTADDDFVTTMQNGKDLRVSNVKNADYYYDITDCLAETFKNYRDANPEYVFGAVGFHEMYEVLPGEVREKADTDIERAFENMRKAYEKLDKIYEPETPHGEVGMYERNMGENEANSTMRRIYFDKERLRNTLGSETETFPRSEQHPFRNIQEWRYGQYKQDGGGIDASVTSRRNRKKGIEKKPREDINILDYIKDAGKNLLARDSNQWRSQIDDLEKGTFKGDEVTMFSKTPLVFELVGAAEKDGQNVPLIMDVSKINKAMNDHPEISYDMLRKLPERIQDPMLVLRSKSIGGDVLVVVEGKNDVTDPTVVVALSFDLKNNNGKRVRKITSIYKKDNNSWYESELGDNLLYRNNKKSRDWMRATRVSFPLAFSHREAAGKKVATEADLVKLLQKKYAAGKPGSNVLYQRESVQPAERPNIFEELAREREAGEAKYDNVFFSDEGGDGRTSAAGRADDLDDLADLDAMLDDDILLGDDWSVDRFPREKTDVQIDDALDRLDSPEPKKAEGMDAPEPKKADFDTSPDGFLATERIIRQEQEAGTEHVIRQEPPKADFDATPDRFLDGERVIRQEPAKDEARFNDPEAIAEERRKLRERLAEEERRRAGDIRGAFGEGATGSFLVLVQGKASVDTVLHEMGHMFLETLRREAEGGQAWANEWWKAVAKDLGAAEDVAKARLDAGEWSRVQETFARMFIDYVHRGQAPSAALETAFDRFAAWLVRMWRKIRRDNDAIDVTPEMADLMDRLLATDEEIVARNEMTDTFRRMGRGAATRNAADMVEAAAQTLDDPTFNPDYRKMAGDDLRRTLGELSADERAEGLGLAEAGERNWEPPQDSAPPLPEHEDLRGRTPEELAEMDAREFDATAAVIDEKINDMRQKGEITQKEEMELVRNREDEQRIGKEREIGQVVAECVLNVGA